MAMASARCNCVTMPLESVFTRAMGGMLVRASSSRQRAWKISPSEVGESRRVDTRRIRERLGFVPRYGDCTAGLRASLVADPR